jgi:hypothetical protein
LWGEPSLYKAALQIARAEAKKEGKINYSRVQNYVDIRFGHT